MLSILRNARLRALQRDEDSTYLAGHSSPGVPSKLDVGLYNRRWLRCLYPFLHYRAERVLEPQLYASVEAQFQHFLSLGLYEHRKPQCFSRTSAAFDAYMLDLWPELNGPLQIFLSQAWHDIVAGLFGVTVTGDILCSLHHHAVRSRSGKIHNDFNPAWFACDKTSPGCVNVAQLDVCNYRTGQADPGTRVRETARAIAVIFYLGNQPWKSGDGGETGLYASAQASVESPAAMVPPTNNSLVAFECTPFSFHSFIKNRKYPRNSVILWLHRSIEDALGQWGRHSIAYWPENEHGKPT